MPPRQRGSKRKSTITESLPSASSALASTAATNSWSADSTGATAKAAPNKRAKGRTTNTALDGSDGEKKGAHERYAIALSQHRFGELTSRSLVFMDSSANTPMSDTASQPATAA